MSTIKDVAKRAGVSTATVSNYLNKTKPVSRQAGKRIDEAVEYLHYNINMTAQSLKSRRYQSIGVILPNLNDSYYVQVYQGIESAFRGTGYHLNLAFSYDLPELEEQVARSFLARQVGGLILVSCCPDKADFYEEHFIKQGRPIVLIDRNIESLQTDFIGFDNELAIGAVSKALLESGRRNPVLMVGPDKFTCETLCISGFQKFFPDATISSVSLEKEDAFRKTTGLLKGDLPDAILATSELTATGIVEAMAVLGFSQKQIPVITLGEEHWNRHTHSFAVCSINRPAIRLGSKAAMQLLNRVDDPTVCVRNYLLSCDMDEVNHQVESLFATKKKHITENNSQSIRILLLDTPAVHSFCRLLKNFENTTGIQVVAVLKPHNNLYNTIVDASDSYDIVMYDMPWLPILASQNILQQLEQVDAAPFLPEAMEYYGKFNGQHFGVPLMYAPQMLYYRNNLFEDQDLCAKYEKKYGLQLKPPRTFPEFNTVARFFTEDTDKIPFGISIAGAYPECLSPEIYMRLRAYDSQVVDAKGIVVFDNPRTLKAYTNFLQAIQYAKPDYRHTTDVDAAESFLSGETAMLISYPGFLVNVSDLRKNSRLGSIGCNFIPGRAPILGGWGLGISSRSQRSEEARLFLDWATNAAMGNYFSMLGGYTAVSATYTNDELVNLYPWLPRYRDIYPYAKPMLPNISRGSRVVSPNDIDEVVCKWLYRLLDGSVSAEYTIKNTQREIQDLVTRSLKISR